MVMNRESEATLSAQQEYMLPLRLPGQGMRRRKQGKLQSATKRKPYPSRRQGNRWDQYGESSSATSSEAHITSDYVHRESTWGPYVSAQREKRTAQPYRLQKANPEKDGSFWQRGRVGRMPFPRQDSGGPDCGMRRISQVQLETLLMLAIPCTI